MDDNEQPKKYLSDGRVATYAYWVCDKTHCGKQNNREIYKYDRTLVTGPCPIINTDDTCDHCGFSVHEPIFIEVKNS